MWDEHKRAEPSVLFAAANSGRGFANFYRDIFGREEIERRYLIKGGPGTGKSTLMRRVAQEAEAQGFSVEYYRCSSDPDSLDAVIIGSRVAIIDATAPHSMDPELPGARDDIVDLGCFWNSEGLADKLDEIKALAKKKSSCYRGAYRFLSAAMNVQERNREIILPYLRREKMHKYVRKITRCIPNGDKYELLVGLCNSLGMKGEVHLPTFEKKASKLYLVEDAYGMGGELLAMVSDEAVSKQSRIRVSYCPLNPSCIDAVFFEDSGEAFVIDKGHSTGERIGVKRFLDTSASGLGGEVGKSVKREYRLNSRMIRGLIQSASDCLAEAGKYHFELENIYIAQMNFQRLELFSREFCDRVMAYLNKR